MRPLWVLLSIAWLGDGVCYLRAAAQGASSSAADAGDFRGGMGCPCIEVDHAALSAQYPKSNIEVDEEAGCLRAPRSAEGVGATRTYVGWPPQFRALPSKAVKQHSLTRHARTCRSCFPLTYGSNACRAWDATVSEFCADEEGEVLSTANPTCGYAWCFVNATQCRRSSTLFSRSRLYAEADLFYSYDTCIAHDDTTQQDWPFRRYESWRQLGGRRLRIGVPYMAEPFYFKQVEIPIGFLRTLLKPHRNPH
jgi:hypothetical protein